jgi:NAD(P)-dependent dehydrogenase (short-subunit alcohol dehydrogenase family)
LFALSENSQPLAGRLALVTGASRGIGYATALALAKAGAHLIATARTQGGLEELDDAILAATGERATLVPADITDGEGLDRLGAAIYQRWGKLDILVSNAGELGLITPVGHLDPKIWDRAVAVNMTANYRLIRSMDPLLRASEAGRALFVTSTAAVKPHAFWSSYAATKAGMEMLVRVYADEVAHTPVRCALVNPGPLRTRMRMNAFPGEDPADLTPPEAITPLMVELARGDLEPPTATVDYRTWAAARAQAD